MLIFASKKEILMNENDIQPLRTVYHRKLAETTLGFKRYLYGQINWDVRMLGIKGEKGVGKTTLILQHILIMHICMYIIIFFYDQIRNIILFSEMNK